jgi:hypothetical protein
MFSDTQFNYFYYWQYRDLSQKIDFSLRVLSTFTTGAGVACLILEKNAPIIWTIIIAISQTYQTLQHLLPFQERTIKINYFLPPFQKLLNEIRRKWEYIDSFNDEEIAELIFKFRDEYISLEQEFIGSYPFPHRKCCKKKAENSLKDYFDYHYNFQGGD